MLTEDKRNGLNTGIGTVCLGQTSQLKVLALLKMAAQKEYASQH